MEFRSHTFGPVRVEQFGGWGSPYGWRFIRHNMPIGVEVNPRGVEAGSEIDAIKLGLILGRLSDKDWHEINCLALAEYSRRSAA